MAFDGFMKIANVPGESTDKDHSEWIEIMSFSHGISQPAAVQASARGGVTTGRVDIQDFSVTKTLDKASPKLALACCNGDHFDTVQLELCKATGSKQKYMEYKLSNVVVASVRPSGMAHGNGDVPVEEVTFRFGKIEWKYTATDAKSGQAKGSVASGWDLTQNVKV